MNESEINRVFKMRYDHAIAWINKFKFIYATLCVVMIFMGIHFSIKWDSLFILGFFLSIPAICYPLMKIKMFSRWSEKNLRRILNESKGKTVGSIWGVQAVFGMYQINYSYYVDDKKYKAYDIVNKHQFLSVYEGLDIPVRYMKNKPKWGYIKI